MHLPITSRLVLASLACVAVSPATAQVSFPVAFHSTADALTESERANITAHVQAAGAKWIDVLDITGPRSLEVEISLSSAPTANGGSVTSSFVGVVGGRNLYEQGAAAELRTGVDINGAGLPDIRIIFGTAFLRDELWFDPDPVARTAPVPLDKTDAMSVALHELGHALAYNGWANGQGIPPATHWSAFDRWMLPGSPTLFGGPDAMLQFGTAPELTTYNIHHWGNGPVAPLKRQREQTVQWRNGVPVPWLGCEGMVYVDPPLHDMPRAKGSVPTALIYELMNGVVSYRGSRYGISALDVATLRDVGLPARSVLLFTSGFE